jgi:nucleoside-diphosphate-sugar epimerase
MAGVDFVVHSAAQIGGTWSRATPEDFERVNQWGSINVLAAAEKAGVKRTLMILSGVLFEPSETLDERSRIVPVSGAHSPYTRTKLAAYYESMARAARGQDIVFVVPGGIYGPAPILSRALAPTSFSSTLLRAIKGELKRYIGVHLSWGYSRDVAAVSLAALEKGRRGERYLACGRSDEDMSLPEFCNLMCELAGVKHRVETVPLDKVAGDAEFGSMVKYLRASYPKPLVNSAATDRELGVAPTPVREGLLHTLRWLEASGQI